MSIRNTFFDSSVLKNICKLHYKKTILEKYLFKYKL